MNRGVYFFGVLSAVFFAGVFVTALYPEKFESFAGIVPFLCLIGGLIAFLVAVEQSFPKNDRDQTNKHDR
jgi:hypothetical protein